LTFVPDKRQESKQRRAARNRANREALAARRDNALTSPTPTRAAASSRSSTGAGAKGGVAGPRAAGPSEPPPSGLMGMLQSKRPGDKAVLAAFALAVVAAIYLLFYQVPADDRGEPLPAVFRGLALAARERLIGEPVPDNEVSLLDASGPQILLVLALPIAVSLFALWANRRADRSRMLTFAMLAMAGSVILTGGIGIFFFPAMIALAVGGFRVRKADLPARVAERTAGGGGWPRGRGAVIDADSQDVTDEGAGSILSRARRGRRGVDAPAPGDDASADEVEADEPADAEVDPLTELEAEIEAERAAEAETEAGTEAETGMTDDDGDAGSPGWRRRKR
jgi:hypothetical protein